MGTDEKPVGLTKDTGWQIGVRRTLPIPHTDAWKLITSATGIETWLGSASGVSLTRGATYELPNGDTGEVRVFHPNSHLRITWLPKGRGWPRPSTLQIRVVPKGDKTTLVFHQEHLPGPDEREERRAFFKTALDELEKIIHTG